MYLALKDLEEGQDIPDSVLFDSCVGLSPITAGISIVVTNGMIEAYEEERMWESNGLPRP